MIIEEWFVLKKGVICTRNRVGRTWKLVLPTAPRCNSAKGGFQNPEEHDTGCKRGTNDLRRSRGSARGLQNGLLSIQREGSA